jgi:pimeloyl-ACP methyl ester carboxylesterase
VGDVTRVEVDTPTSGTLSIGKTGQGTDLVLLHRSIGGDSLSGFVETLSSQFRVLAPSLPGYDDSTRPDWARSPRDLAPVVLHTVGPLARDRPVLVGLGLGAWVAAEVAVMSPERLRALVLIAPLGVQPRTGEITDPFLVSTDRYIEMGFADLEAHARTFSAFGLGTDAWLRRERNREMTTRIAWRPRMFDQTLPFRLPYISTPTLIAWGDKDLIVPQGVVDRYRDAIPGAELVVLPGSGHMLECEVPEQVRELISSFVAKHE